jgi:hypothetical protein
MNFLIFNFFMNLLCCMLNVDLDWSSAEHLQRDEHRRDQQERCRVVVVKAVRNV